MWEGAAQFVPNISWKNVVDPGILLENVLKISIALEHAVSLIINKLRIIFKSDFGRKVY